MGTDSTYRLEAVCFDFKGTLIDHKSGQEPVPGTESLLTRLKEMGFILAVISRNPVSVVVDVLGPLMRFFKDRVYSSGGKGKRDCLIAFAKAHNIDALSTIAFIDDKPENLLPVARETDISVIGFAGSGKYPETRRACLENGIPFVETTADLAVLLHTMSNLRPG